MAFNITQLTCFFSPRIDIQTGQNFLKHTQTHTSVCSSISTRQTPPDQVFADGPDSLLHCQEAEQRLVRLLVELQRVLPVLGVQVLLLQAVEGEERRVERRQQHREEQRGGAHHRHAGEGRGKWGSGGRSSVLTAPGRTSLNGCDVPAPSPLHGSRTRRGFRWRAGRLGDDGAIFWQPWEQEAAGQETTRPKCKG